jgi:hypothetical protein
MQKVSVPTIIAVTLIFLGLSFIGLIGLLGSDDADYIASSLNISWDFIPQSHWEFRYLILLYLNGFWMIGVEPNSVSIIVAMKILGVLLLTVFFYNLAKLENTQGRAFLSIILVVITFPFIQVYTSFVNVDVIELFLVACTALYLMRFINSGDRANLFIAGILAGVSLLNRETSVLYLIAMALAFLVINRRQITPQVYVLSILIALTPFLLETVYLFVKTGDAFYHINTVIDSHLKGGIGDMNTKHGTVTGNLLPGTIFEKITVLLANHEYGFIFWLFFGFWLINFTKIKSLEPSQKFLLLVILFSILLLSFSGVVRLLARYYFPIALLASVSLFLATANSKNKLNYVFALGIVITNVTFLLLENTLPAHHSKQIVSISNEVQNCIQAPRILIQKAKALNKSSEFKSDFLSYDCDSVYEYRTLKTSTDKSQLLLTHEIVKEYPSPKLPLNKIFNYVGLNSMNDISIIKKLQLRNEPAVVLKRKNLE